MLSIEGSIMDCRVILQDRIIILGDEDINFNYASLPLEFFKETDVGFEYDKEGLKYLSDKIVFIVSKLQLNHIYILFNKPEFFDDNLLNSKILKRFKRKYSFLDDDFIIEHPTKAILKEEKHSWSHIEFTYDPRQGDISMGLSY